MSALYILWAMEAKDMVNTASRQAYELGSCLAARRSMR